MVNGLPEIRISRDIMKSEFCRILVNNGFTSQKSEECADIFTINSLEGVYSHGVNRFPRFVRYIQDGYIRPDAEPSLIACTGALEQWNGNLGPGPLNATAATRRSTEIAETNGIGLVAMANTNHWMRGGTYGWQAVRKGFVFIGWTNTCQNMPAWGAKDPRLGNNPFVIAVPFKDEAIVLDFAMTQFSYGKMESLKVSGGFLPFPGGYSLKGELTANPAEVLESMRPLPIGYWKGAGLSLLLDILAAILSGGLPSSRIQNCQSEHAVSQVFIAINLKALGNFPAIEETVVRIIADLKESVPENDKTTIRYPGENVVRVRNENLTNGIPVSKALWDKILSL
jgi:3-dehydro-L-gulonate 2-dehydrogenase